MPKYHEYQIRSILSQVKQMPSEELESESVEFKGYATAQALHNAKDLAEELSALANLDGGVIIIGVRDNSDVPFGEWQEQLQGVTRVDILETKERIAGKLKPAVQLTFSNIEYDGKAFIAIEIEKSWDSLVSTSSGKICIREGRSSRPMTPDEIERAVKSLTRYDWSSDFPDSAIDISFDPGSLRDAIADFQEKRGLSEPPTEEAYLEAIGATKNGRITRGGLLFLGSAESIRDSLGLFEFRFSWKKPTGELEINDIWTGNLWQAIRRAENHFEQCNSIGVYGFEDTVFDVPLMDKIAFHEALLNAMVHRDYSVDGMTSITYSGDEMRIHSPGTFFGGVTSDNIAKHEPRHRNKNLARILMTHNLVDRAGMGVLRMGLGSLRYGRAFPDFREESDAVEVRLEAKYLRPGIAVLGIQNKDTWGIPEFLILNSVYETGVASIGELERRLERLVDAPIDVIARAASEMPQVEICGTKDGVFVRVVLAWKTLMSVEKIFRTYPSSGNYVKLFRYLRTHGNASNADLTDLLGYNHSSQTSKFLRETKFVERYGSGPSARWRISGRKCTVGPRRR